MTRYELFVNRWKDCTRCDLHQVRKRVVLARGKIPSDIVFVGEAPGECLAGNTLIEVAYRDKEQYPNGIPIRELVGKSDFQVYSYDTDHHKLILGTVKKVWQTGVKVVYRVRYYWWGARPGGKAGRMRYCNSIKVTDNHPFLLRSGQYRSIQQGLSVGDSLIPFYRHKIRYPFVGVHHTSMTKESIFLLENKMGRRLEKGEQVHHSDRNKWNDSWDNLVLMDIVEHARLHGLEDNPMVDPVHRETHRKATESDDYRSKMSSKMKDTLAKPDKYAKRLKQIDKQRDQTSKTVKKKFATDPIFYYHYLLGVQKRSTKMTDRRVEEFFKRRFPNVDFPPEDNHKVLTIEKVGVEDVYDMQVDPYPNFAANGIFVHNSEDKLGIPFIGPSGKLLDQIIERSVPSGVSYSLTNMVCCIPRDVQVGNKAGKPLPTEVNACSARLIEFLEITRPKLLVAVGALARDYLTPGYKHSVKLPFPIPMVDITHPAALLMSNIAMRGLAIQRCIVTIANAVEEYLSNEDKEQTNG